MAPAVALHFSGNLLPLSWEECSSHLLHYLSYPMGVNFPSVTPSWTPAHLTDPEAQPSPDPLDSSAVLTPGSFHELPSPVPGSWLVAAAAGLAHSHLVAQIHQIPETVFPQSSADNRSTGTLKASHVQP